MLLDRTHGNGGNDRINGIGGNDRVFQNAQCLGWFFVEGQETTLSAEEMVTIVSSGGGGTDTLSGDNGLDIMTGGESGSWCRHN